MRSNSAGSSKSNKKLHFLHNLHTVSCITYWIYTYFVIKRLFCKVHPNFWLKNVHFKSRNNKKKCRHQATCSKSETNLPNAASAHCTKVTLLVFNLDLMHLTCYAACSVHSLHKMLLCRSERVWFLQDCSLELKKKSKKTVVRADGRVDFACLFKSRQSSHLPHFSHFIRWKGKGADDEGQKKKKTHHCFMVDDILELWSCFSEVVFGYF